MNTANNYLPIFWISAITLRVCKTFIVLLITILFKPLILEAQPGQWTWMKGDTLPNTLGHYGIQGVPDPANTPRSSQFESTWTDLQGNFWLYEGASFGGYQGNLWKYDVSTNIWTWMKGPGLLFTIQQPVYGTQGISLSTNTPGYRLGSACWADNQGNFWLFGDQGSFPRNDLWKFTISTNEWTWVKGPQTIGDTGSYGILQVSALSNNPPALSKGSCSWTDNNGDLWLFGGAVDDDYPCNDLWKYSISTNTWTWMNGSHSHNPPGNFGTLFVPSPQNAPSGRIRSASWKDNYGNLWLFGGHSMLHSLNDLWKFDPTTNLWTWMGGSTVGDLPTTSSGFCTPSQANIPAARVSVGSTWQGQCGQLYLYGGFTQIQQNAKWADLWCFNVNTLEWTLVNGSLTPNDSAFYGQQNISSPLNHPAALFGASSWKDLNGNFWLFGGVRALNGYKTMNTLWRYVPDTNCPQTVSLSAMTAPPDTSLCTGDSVLLVASGGQSYLWQPQASLSNPFDSVTYAFPDSTTQYSLTISNECGQKTFQFKVVVNADSNFFVAFQDTLICQGDTLNLQADGGTHYHWIPENLCDNPYIPNPSISPEVSTLFELTASNDCFKKTLQVFVEVIPDSIKRISQEDTAVCHGDSLVLDASGGSYFIWNTGENTNSVNVSPEINSYYSVTITDDFGCIGTDSIFVSINPTPVISINPVASPICLGSDILLEANGGADYQWYPKLFVTNTFLNTITVQPEYSITYTVIGSDIFGCKDSSKVQVEVKDCLLTIPNVFTPNDDGKNDRFEILCDGLLPCHTQIYNRWGKLLFESDAMEDHWDGTYNGQPVPAGTYFYLIETQTKSYKGTISIIR